MHRTPTRSRRPVDATVHNHMTVLAQELASATANLKIEVETTRASAAQQSANFRFQVQERDHLIRKLTSQLADSSYREAQIVLEHKMLKQELLQMREKIEARELSMKDSLESSPALLLQLQVSLAKHKHDLKHAQDAAAAVVRLIKSPPQFADIREPKNIEYSESLQEVQRLRLKVTAMTVAIKRMLMLVKEANDQSPTPTPTVHTTQIPLLSQKDLSPLSRETTLEIPEIGRNSQNSASF
jgi:hypothetical protein